MPLLTFKTYFEDSIANIERVKIVENLSKYHLVKWLAGDIEFLGKCMIAEPKLFTGVTNEKGEDITEKLFPSNKCFEYGILKLNSFKDYRKYVKLPNFGEKCIGDEILKLKSNSNYIEDYYNLFSSTDKNVNSDFVFYSAYRCNFSHSNCPGKTISLSNNNTTPHKKDNIWVLGTVHIIECILNAYKEILNTEDNKIKDFLNNQFLQIKNN